MTAKETELETALRTIARAIAPYVAEELAGRTPTAAKSDGEWGDDEIRGLLEGLKPEAILGGLELFHALSESPHRIDSVSLADRIGLPPASLSGKVLRPIGARAADLGLPTPWKTVGRVSGRTEWAELSDTAERLYQAFQEASSGLERPQDPLRHAQLSTGGPPPTAIFTFAPEYAEDLDRPRKGSSSCLRGSKPGSRAVIYQVHDDQRIVALFDVMSDPRPDDDWRYIANGYYIPVPHPVSRARLLAHDELASMFTNIQGRRWLPEDAQRALTALLIAEGGFTNRQLPTHALAREKLPAARRRSR